MTSEELELLLLPAIVSLGYELTDLEVKVGGRDGVVRLFIDHPDGIGLDDCEAVSREVSAILDVEDPIPGNYNLEVSSPGLDRRLRTREHFERFAGEEVRIKMRVPIEGRRNYRGVIGAADDTNVDVEVDGVVHQLPIADIASARLIPSGETVST